MYKPTPEKLTRILAENKAKLKEVEEKLVEVEKLAQKLRDEVTDLTWDIMEDTKVLNSISRA
jgi:hypothetical protein